MSRSALRFLCRLICEPHSLRFSPLSWVVLGLFPRSRERGFVSWWVVVWGVGGCVWLVWLDAPAAFCVFRLVALGSLGEDFQAIVGAGGIASP